MNVVGISIPVLAQGSAASPAGACIPEYSSEPMSIRVAVARRVVVTDRFAVGAAGGAPLIPFKEIRPCASW
ncbi:hypothetical protein C7S14_0770 [Burkholderia cepacia]|nr:hypothetical protein C7S14_0770 [Burkholderia cepacia]